MKFPRIYNQSDKAAKANNGRLSTVVPSPEIDDYSRLSDDLIDRQTLFFNEPDIKDLNLSGIDDPSVPVNVVSSRSAGHTSYNGKEYTWMKLSSIDARSPSKAEIEVKLRALQVAILDSNPVNEVAIPALHSNFLPEDIKTTSPKMAEISSSMSNLDELNPIGNTSKIMSLVATSQKANATDKLPISSIGLSSNKNFSIPFNTKCTGYDYIQRKRKINQLKVQDYQRVVDDKATTTPNDSYNSNPKKPRQEITVNKIFNQCSHKKTKDTNPNKVNNKPNNIRQSALKKSNTTQSKQSISKIKIKSPPFDVQLHSKVGQEKKQANSNQGLDARKVHFSNKYVVIQSTGQKTWARKPKSIISSIMERTGAPSHPYKNPNSQTKVQSRTIKTVTLSRGDSLDKNQSDKKVQEVQVKSLNGIRQKGTTITNRPRWR